MAAAFLAALALALPIGAPALAHGGGGGGGGHYVVIVVPGAAANVPLFRGDEASLSLEITDAAPAPGEGDMKIGDVIAVHQLRSTEARVLTDPVKGRRRTLPAGTVLARMSFVAGSRESVWCDLRPTNRPLWPQEHDCLEETGGDGHFDQLWQGDSQTGFLGFGMSGVGHFNDVMAAPAGYRAATPEERPTALLGFRYCDGDGIKTPPRFAVMVAVSDASGLWPLKGSCSAGVWPDPADPSTVDVNGMILKVTPNKDGSLHYRVLKALPAEAIAPLQAGVPVMSAADAPTPAAKTAALDALIRHGALDRDGAATVTWGPVALGQTFLTGKVRHAITGTLQNRISPSVMWRLDSAVEVGQPMFGLPGKGWGADGIVWCAPRIKAGVWETACFLPMGAFYYWIPHREPALLPDDRAINSLSQTGSVSSDPSVKRGPVDLPPMTLSLILRDIQPRAKTDPTLVYDIDVDIDWGAGPQKINTWVYELPPEGRIVPVLGQFMVLKPGATAQQMTVQPAVMVVPRPPRIPPPPPIAPVVKPAG